MADREHELEQAVRDFSKRLERRVSNCDCASCKQDRAALVRANDVLEGFGRQVVHA